MTNGKSLIGPRVEDGYAGPQPLAESGESFPREAVALRPPAEDTQPQPHQVEREPLQRAGARWDRVVAKPPTQHLDVLVCHPRLVQTGLDLVDFPTICWYETDYSVYTMRQASSRSWRIGQTQPVQVVFMAYRNTLQADALKLVAKKLQSSLAVEGELPEDGLAAFGDDGDDLMLALARKIVAGEEDADSVESVFAQAQQVAAEAEALLVDAEWAAPEPMVADGVAVGAGADDNREDADEPQRSLFSWAEFMAEEQVEPRRHRRNEAPTLSLFEWALDQEREGAMVAVSR